MKERLKLVESFSELKAGMIVVLSPCGECGGIHRAMLIRIASGEGFFIDGEYVVDMAGWFYAPKMPCDNLWGPTEIDPVITERSVANRRVYRVDDGLESYSQTTTRRRHPKTEAAR